jgi:hypothetical protein
MVRGAESLLFFAAMPEPAAWGAGQVEETNPWMTVSGAARR